VLDNFSIASKDTELGAMVVVLATNPSNSRRTDGIQGSDSTGIAVRFNKGESTGSRSERMGVAGALKVLDIGLLRSKLVI
jgi:hypothetical protein